jgi:hypothetical protein
MIVSRLKRRAPLTPDAALMVGFLWQRYRLFENDNDPFSRTAGFHDPLPAVPRLREARIEELAQ